MRQNYLFTSESVSEGHPDKVCDQISDKIVDAYLAKDPYSRVAVETLATTNHVTVAGEVRSEKSITHGEIDQLIRDCVKHIGYEQEGFHWKNLKTDILIHSQSSDIAMGVDELGDHTEGAGDQGMMFGYACKETSVLMPAPIYYAHRILHNLSSVRHNRSVQGLGPDAKSQITMVYENGKPVRAESIVVSTQHDENLSQEDVRKIVKPIIEQSLPEGWMCSDDKLYVNPTGRFVIGGPDGDTGLTGRKIIVDTYGGASPHGGGAFSGKDPTKVDRSAAYMARFLAKNVVAAELAERCTIQLAYVIGMSEPASFNINFHNTGKVSEAEVENKIKKFVDLTPKGIRTFLNLNRPIYELTAAYGHFGREPEANGAFSWEKLDLVKYLA